MKENARNDPETNAYLPPKVGKRDVPKSYVVAILTTMKYEYMDEIILDQLIQRNVVGKLPLEPDQINISDEMVEELLKHP